MKKLLSNARFYTMISENDYYDSVLIENGNILKMFKTKPELTGIEELDLNSAFVYPGFIDTHTHSFEGGLYNLGTYLGDISTLKDLFAKLSFSQPISNKIFAYGFDENKIKEKRFPTASELDRIFPDKPEMLWI